jgi:hypothetical protein
MRALWLLAFSSAAAFACSSTDAPSPGGASGAGGAAAAPGAGAPGVAGSATAGAPAGGASGAASAGSPGSAGTAAAGASAAGAAGMSSAGASGSAGAGGALVGGAGAAGAAGAVDPGNLPNMIPAGYTGTPFGGTPQAIPGKIEIEKYDLGGLNVAFKADTAGAYDKCGFARTDALKLQCTQQQGSPADKTAPGCGMEPAGQTYLGYIGAGNWYKYTVNVLQAGTYVISGHEGVAGNTQMQFTFTDAVKTGNLTLPSTDVCSFEAYHVWAVHDNLGEIALTPGKYVLTINVVAAAMNLDWFAFTKK